MEKQKIVKIQEIFICEHCQQEIYACIVCNEYYDGETKPEDWYCCGYGDHYCAECYTNKE